MTTTRGAQIARNPPLACSTCGVSLTSVELHVAGWQAGHGLTYWCVDCDPRKNHNESGPGGVAAPARGLTPMKEGL